VRRMVLVGTRPSGVEKGRGSWGWAASWEEPADVATELMRATQRENG